MVETTMDISSWLRKQLEQASPDLLREMVQGFAEALMGAEADALCGAGYGERSPERVNQRNGYRERTWDTRTGTIELALPKLREGSYFPDWLLTLGFDPARFQTEPPACYRASWQLPGRDSHPRATTSFSWIRSLRIDHLQTLGTLPARGVRALRVRRGLAAPP